MKAIINMTTAFLLLLMFLFGWSLVTYNENPEKYQWLDANGEFKTSSYDVEVSYNLDTPLDDLNGNSLREVFSDNNDYNNGIYAVGLLLDIETDEYNIYNVTSTSTSAVHIRPDLSVWNFQGDYIFHNISFRVYDTIHTPPSILYKYRYYTGSWTNVTDVYDEEIQNDYRKLLYYSNVNFRFSIRNTGLNAKLQVYKDDLVYINMTDLGIQNVTSDVMYYWYSEYQRLQDNQIENYKELGSTVESSWQFLTGYFTTLVDILDAQVQVILNPFEALAEGLSIITVPIFG
jgi:hypothetical protein